MIIILLEYLINIWNFLFGHLIFFNILVSILIIFFQRRDPKAVWTWLLALYFIPVFGILFYLILGQDYRKSKIFKVKEAEDKLELTAKNQEIMLRSRMKDVSDEFLRDYGDLIYYNLETGASILTVNNKINIFTSGNEKFADLISEIKNAKSYIHMQYYIIKNDYLFDSISAELIKKADQGVEVRILCDGMGGRFMPKKHWQELESHGIKVGIFFPATLGRINLRINYRNHRKIVIIDGMIGYVGGFNIGKEYVDGDKKFGHWRDTHLKIIGEAVSSLQVRFAMDWNYATHENLFLDEKYLKYYGAKYLTCQAFEENMVPLGIQIITSGPDSENKKIRDNYIELFNKAKNHIYIQTPYFVPDEAVLSALLIAVKSGVDVRLMIPCMPDHPFVYWATYSWAGTLLYAGARIYTYQNGFLHAKTVTADGRCACVGTANMDIRSFELNFEVNATIYDEDTTEALENEFLNDINFSKEILKEDYAKRNMSIRFKEQISRLLSQLL